MNLATKKTFVIFSVVVMAGSCPTVAAAAEKYSESRPLFGTIVKIDACYEKQEEPKALTGIKKAWERLDEIQWRMNIYDERSDITKINNSNQKAVTIGADTYQLLKDSTFFTNLTKGAFDITVYPFIQLWKKAEETNALPSKEDLEHAKSAVGSANIEFLDENHVRLLNRETAIDINGIASGYGADEAARILRENDLHDFLIDTGGELFASGRNCKEESWRIGVSDPRLPAGEAGKPTELIDVIELNDMGVSTSGNYEKYYEIQGQRWSHIINPMTGYPQMEVTSATVIAPTATQADVLSTALCVLGAEKGIALIESLGSHFAALVFEQDGDDKLVTHQSANYEQFRSKKQLP